MISIKKMISNLLMLVLLVTQLAGTQGMVTVYAQEATQLENVVVSGGSFNTGIYINQNYSVEMKFSLSTLSQYKDLFEAASATNGYVYRLRTESANGLYIKHGWANEKVYTPTVNEEITVTQKKNITYVNNKQVRKTTLQTLKANGSLKFGNFNGNVNSFKVWNESNALVGDFVPVLDADSKACMYDKVTKKYFYYSGTCKAGKKLETPEVSVIPEESKVPESSESNEYAGNDKTESIESELEDTDKDVVTVNYADSLVLSGGIFNTGKMIDQNYSTEIKFSLSNLNQYKNISYASVNSSNFVYNLRVEAASGLYLRHGWYNVKIYSPAVNEELTVTQKKNIFYVNGKQKAKATVQALTAKETLRFGNFSGTIKEYKIWDSKGNLIADYKPALDNTNKACMYDNISKSYVYYSGTCKAVVEEKEETTETETKVETEVETETNVETKVETEVETETKTEPEVKIETETNVEMDKETESEPLPEIEVETDVTNNTGKVTIEDEVLDMYLTGDMGTRDVSQYNVTYAEFYGMWPEFKEKNYILCTSGNNAYPYAVGYSGNYVTKIKIVNMDSDFVPRYKRVVVAIDKFMAGIDNKMTDLDKVVWAHEFLVEHVVYKKTGDLAHTSGGALGDGEAVCQGYALAINALLKLVGIESEYVSSPEMNHGWSYVKLNNEWYHVDVTWDDTRKNADGANDHKYFLRNDSEFKSLKYTSWKATSVASKSTKYTNWFVRNAYGTMKYSDGLWYYYDKSSNSIKASDINGTSTKVIVSNCGGTAVIKSVKGNVVTYTVNGTVYTKNI